MHLIANSEYNNTEYSTSYGYLWKLMSKCMLQDREKLTMKLGSCQAGKNFYCISWQHFSEDLISDPKTTQNYTQAIFQCLWVAGLGCNSS